MAKNDYSFKINTIFFCCFYLTLCFCINTSSAENDEQLAHQICKKTTNYSFCKQAVYSDPRAPTADRYVLAYIAFGKAYANASSTNEAIDLLIKNAKTGPKKDPNLLAGLQECKSFYEDAVQAILEAWSDLDSETFDGLESYAISADDASQKCEAVFKGRSPLTKQNQNLSLLAKICVVVSKLYEVS